MNIQTSLSARQPNVSAAKPAAVGNEASAENQNQDSIQISVPIPEVNIDIAKIGKLAYKGARALPGAATLALNAPVVAFAPVLNAFSPATNNREAVYYERWANIGGTAAIGSAVGAAVGALSGNAWAGAGIGAASGFAAGSVRSLVSQIWTPTVGHGYYNQYEAAKYPEIGTNAASADNSSTTKSHAFGSRLRAGYATAFTEAFEDGGRAMDSLANFSRGLAGQPDQG